MYKVSHSSQPLTPEEKRVFQSHLDMLGVDENIWNLYEKFLQTASKYSIPRIVRIHDQNNLQAAVYLMKCKDHGETLTSSRFLQRIIRNTGIPVYLWMKSGIAAENFTNPGFINREANMDNEKLIQLLKKNLFFYSFMIWQKMPGFFRAL